jgi:DnaK suppressor protein
MKKNKKALKKTVAASKSKKAAPPKKPAKPAQKPKAKVPEKKVAAKAPAKELVKAQPAKKPAPAPAKVEPKKDDKKAPFAAKGAAPKGKVEDKIAMGKKGDKAGATAIAKAPPPAPLKVEPKIIEAPQPEFKTRDESEQLFTSEEIEQFRVLLTTERNKILAKARKAMEDGGIQIDKNEMFDEVDQASAMVEQNLTFRLLDRDRKLLSEIDHAIAKLDSGDFGYCEGTGEPIPKRRLELRPWCRHSVKYKEKLERMKKSGRGVVDEDEM